MVRFQPPTVIEEYSGDPKTVHPKNGLKVDLTIRKPDKMVQSLNVKPFENRTIYKWSYFDHLKTGPIQFSDPHWDGYLLRSTVGQRPLLEDLRSVPLCRSEWKERAEEERRFYLKLCELETRWQKKRLRCVNSKLEK